MLLNYIKSMETNLINCTEHRINVKLASGEFMTLEPSGHVVRVDVTRREVLRHGDLVFHRSIPGEVTGMPTAEERDGKFIVVSLAARMALKEQGIISGICSPGKLIRNEAGQPIGCDGLDIM